MNETLADIVAGMRNPENDYITNNDLRDLADRIEAAAKRERAVTDAMLACKGKMFPHPDPEHAPPPHPGNAAALRKALKYARDVLAFTCRIDWRTTMAWGELHDAIHKSDAALAASPRNCDRFRTEEEAYAEFGKAGNAFGTDTSERLYRYARWLFAPEGGAR